MPAMFLFPAKQAKIEARIISACIKDAFGVAISPWDNDKVTDRLPKPVGSTHEGAFFFDLPELEEEEGTPVAYFRQTIRAERSEEIQALADEIIAQDAEFEKLINKNQTDIVVSFEQTPASFEAAALLTYAFAESFSCGVLIPGFEEGEETVWFENAEDFANDVIFGEDDEDEDEDDDDDESSDVEDDDELIGEPYDEDDEDEDDDAPKKKKK
jgi:hypothetical protein